MASQIEEKSVPEQLEEICGELMRSGAVDLARKVAHVQVDVLYGGTPGTANGTADPLGGYDKTRGRGDNKTRGQPATAAKSGAHAHQS